MKIGNIPLTFDILSLFIDSRYRFWVGTREGLFLYDKLTGCGKKMRLHSTDNYIINAICEDKDQNIWLATNRGVIQIQKGNVSPTEIIKEFEEKASIVSRYVLSILAATDGRIYVGYSNGFGVISRKESKIVEYYTVNDGLCNDEVACLTQDDNGQIWLGNSSGVSRYSASQKLFYNNYISGSNSSVLLLDSTLFWGNNKCLTYFDPQKVNQIPVNNHVFLVMLIVNNEVINTG